MCIIKSCPLICRIWVRHAVPKFIEIETSTIATEFGIGGWLSIDTCDAVIRSFQSVDINGAGPVWRHFLESDFAVTKSSYSFWALIFREYTIYPDAFLSVVQMRILGNEDFTKTSSIQLQFRGDHIPYEVGRCQMVRESSTFF